MEKIKQNYFKKYVLKIIRKIISQKMVFSTKNFETIVLVQSVFNINAMLVILIMTIAILGKTIHETYYN